MSKLGGGWPSGCAQACGWGCLPPSFGGDLSSSSSAGSGALPPRGSPSPSHCSPVAAREQGHRARLLGPVGMWGGSGGQERASRPCRAPCGYSPLGPGASALSSGVQDPLGAPRELWQQTSATSFLGTTLSLGECVQASVLWRPPCTWCHWATADPTAVPSAVRRHAATCMRAAAAGQVGMVHQAPSACVHARASFWQPPQPGQGWRAP